MSIRTLQNTKHANRTIPDNISKSQIFVGIEIFKERRSVTVALKTALHSYNKDFSVYYITLP